MIGKLSADFASNSALSGGGLVPAVGLGIDAACMQELARPTLRRTEESSNKPVTFPFLLAMMGLARPPGGIEPLRTSFSRITEGPRL